MELKARSSRTTVFRSSTCSGIHYMELKVRTPNSWARQPEHQESITWSWKWWNPLPPPLTGTPSGESITWSWKKHEPSTENPSGWVRVHGRIHYMELKAWATSIFWRRSRRGSESITWSWKVQSPLLQLLHLVSKNPLHGVERTTYRASDLRRWL